MPTFRNHMPPRQVWLRLKVPPLALLAAVSLAVWWLPAIAPVALPLAWRAGIGLVAGLAGAAICLAAVLAFRSARTTVDPTAPQEASTLVVRGVFRYSRNPMYLGFVLLLGGHALWLAKLSGLLCVVGFMLYLQRYQIRPEEEALHERFGPAFDSYCARVRRWI